MSFVMVVMMLWCLPGIAAQAEGEGALTYVKSENFTGTVINSAARTITGTNGLAATKVNPQRTIGEVVSGGLGGKPETDSYLLVTRNSEVDNNGGYYFGIVLPAQGNTYTEGNPVTLAFSVYAPENLGSVPFFCQVGPMNDASTSSPSPIGAMYCVTDENAVVLNGGALATQRFLVNAGEWNRISLTMYPNTKNTEVTINGTKYTGLSASKAYGQYLRSLRMQLPIRAGKTDEFMAYDDFVIYSGAGTEAYTAPADALTTSSESVLISGDTIYTAGAFREEDFTVADGKELCVINDASGTAAKLAVWEENNPIPMYYDIKPVADDMVIAQSLTADAEAHAFVAKGFATGTAGTVIIGKYSEDGGQLIDVQINAVTDAVGSFEKTYAIAEYDASKIYKAFWLESVETMNPFLGCACLNMPERN